MFYFEDSAEKHLTEQGYQKLTRKPWNVKADDVILLHHWSTGPLMPEHWIPVVVTGSYSYPEYHRSDTIPNKYTKISRTTYNIDHKALDPETDNKNLIGWWRTTWNSYDETEIWRKTNNNK